MDDVLGYQGKTVVITGAATGMGASAAEMLVGLGAEVWALDIADVKVPVHRAIRTNMMDRASIDAALAELPDRIDVLFNCAGVPHPPTPFVDTVLINFVGLRHLTDALIPRIREGGAIASIASTAGMAWKSNLELVRRFLELDTFEKAEAWLREEPQLNADAYGFSKQALIVYTQLLAGELAKRNVRINCIAPSPTGGVFMQKLTEVLPESMMDPFKPANGRTADPADMGRVMVLLGSDLAGFISGVNLPVDYGYCAEVAMGQRDNLMNIS
jgi:NAD(P)-dependent dehydrogenase (short-subunit alcohol dehydrogenase family)